VELFPVWRKKVKPGTAPAEREQQGMMRVSGENHHCVQRVEELLFLWICFCNTIAEFVLFNTTRKTARAIG
jgi:hypothetical protein